jgi:hypothetical protein
MSSVEKGLKAALTGYVFQDVSGDYQITEKDIGSVIRLYQERKDIFYGRYTWDPEGAKNYFLQNTAPYILDDMWNKVISEGHQPLYAKLNVLEVSNYTADQYYFTYEVDIYFIVKHASPIDIATLVAVIIILVLTGWVLQQVGILAEKLGKAIATVIYVVQSFLQPFIPWIIMLIVVYIMGKIMELGKG